MEMQDNMVTAEQKEFCALTTMRTMLEQYSLKKHISFEDALLAFSKTYAYDALFDFETGIWKEGPDYLASIFEEAERSPQQD